MGTLAAVSLGIPILLGLALHLLTDAIPRLSKIAVDRAAGRLPEALKQNQRDAWLADLATLETDFERLRCACGCWVTSMSIRHPFSLEKSHRDLLAARQELRLHGAIAGYAFGRIKAWDTPGDPKDWTFAERCAFGIIVASGKAMPVAMKKYCLCLEEDCKARPRLYSSKEEAAKDLFVPIRREMIIWKFLKDHELLVIDGQVARDKTQD